MIKLIRTKAKRAFTLIELVVVIAVIAILAGVSVAAYFGVTNSARESAALQEAEQLVTLVNVVASTDGEVDVNGSTEGGEYKLSVTSDGLTVKGDVVLDNSGLVSIFDYIYYFGAEGNKPVEDETRFGSGGHATLVFYGDASKNEADNVEVVVDGFDYTLTTGGTATVGLSADFTAETKGNAILTA